MLSNLQRYLVNNMSINNKQELIDLIKNALVEDLSKIQDKIDIVIEGGDSPRIETIYPKKQLELQAEKLANVMIDYVNSEIQNLFTSLKQQNAYTIANSNSNSSSAFSGITIAPSQIKNYKPLLSTE